MCKHLWHKHNDITVCLRCGLLRTPDGKVLFDRRLPDLLKRPGKKCPK